MSDIDSTLQDRFLEELGVSTLGSAWVWAKNLGDDNAAIRDILSDRTPEEVLRAIGNTIPEAKELTDLIAKDPDLSKALHNALVNDETMLPGLIDLAKADPTNPDALSLDDLTSVMNSPAYQTLGRDKLIGLLNNIADPEKDLTFADLKRLGDQTKTFANFDYNDFVRRMQNDPHGLTRDLIGMLDIQDPAKAEMLAGILDMLMPFMQAFLDPNGFMLGPYTEYYKVHLEGLPTQIQIRGSEILAGRQPDTDTGSTRSASLSADDGNGISVASLRDSFGPNSSGARTDGYTDPASTRVAAANTVRIDQGVQHNALT